MQSGMLADLGLDDADHDIFDRGEACSDEILAYSLKRLRVHDLRHHFISALAQTQTPDATIQAISGHLSRKMLEHCNHVQLEAEWWSVAAPGTMAAQPVRQAMWGPQTQKRKIESRFCSGGF